MSQKIVKFTMVLLMLLAPAAHLVNAQVNETELFPDGTNSTIPDPLLGLNTTITNTTLTNSTIPVTNSTSIEINGTETDSESTNPVVLAFVREQAQEQLQRMHEIFSESNYSPDITNGLIHAEQAMTQAQEFEGRNARAAAQQYLRAMKQYRNILRKHLKDYPDALDTILTAPEENVTATYDINGTVTSEEIEAAQAQLLDQFQERFQNQIAAMIQGVEDVSGDLSPQDVVKAQQALTKAQDKLLRIQEKILNGQFDEATDDLENATSTLNNDLDEMEDTGAAQMIRTINKLEAKIQRLEQRAARKAARGESTDEEDTLIAELRGNKNKIKNDYKENKGKGKGNGKDKSNNGKGKK